MLKIRISLAVLGLISFFGFAFCLFMTGKFPDEPAYGISWLAYGLIDVFCIVVWFAFNDLEPRIETLEDSEDDVWTAITNADVRLKQLEELVSIHIGTRHENDDEILLTAANLRDLIHSTEQEETEPDTEAVTLQEQGLQPTEKFKVVSLEDIPPQRSEE